MDHMNQNQMNMITDNSSELEHYGVKDMHWGIRRYQPYPKGHKGGKFIGEQSKWKKKKLREVQKARAKAEAEKKSAEKKKKEDAELHEKLLKTRDPKLLYKNVHKLSDDELRSRLSRLQNEQALKKLASQQKSKGEEFVDKFVKYGELANKVYKTVNSDVGKAIQKKMGIGEDTKKSTTLGSVKKIAQDANKATGSKVDKKAKQAQKEKEKQTKQDRKEAKEDLREAKTLKKEAQQYKKEAEQMMRAMKKAGDTKAYQEEKQTRDYQKKQIDEINSMIDDIEKQLKKDGLA